ncbi:hypothetical protein GGD56_003911 [Rhizobium mongolense]|uniref:Uncharacterized protein n=2 Tax=Rhizobium mongolense TaxID=57676 RepID=A0ABR6IQR9_9HYPH|nr:hypothetical protein [Rhizobium mongolense]TVZ72809.1 hypothetical protein BCL32_0996 [Rhizobium mongolense USDA 1844]
MKVVWLKDKGYKVEIPPRLIIGLVALAVFAVKGIESVPGLSLILRAVAGGSWG